MRRYFILVIIFVVPLIIGATLRFGNIAEQGIQKELPKPVIPLAIFIDPGHTKSTCSASDIAGDEDAVNLKVAKYLASMLDNDPSFVYEMSRTNDEYGGHISNVAVRMADIFKKISTLKILHDRRTSSLSVEARMNMYAVRYYAIENNFALLLSIHFNYTWSEEAKKNARGYHTVVSPYNRKFDKSLSLARIICDEFSKRDIVNRGIRHDRYSSPYFDYSKYDFDALLKEGVSVRSILILSDAFEDYYYRANGLTPPTDIVSVLVECGFLNEKKYLLDKELYAVALKLYNALVRYKGDGNI